MKYSGGGILKHICPAQPLAMGYKGSASGASKMPERTRGDEGSRLTLSPAVPPDWMHSIQNPGGQITQTPVSVTCQPQNCIGEARGGLVLGGGGLRHGPLSLDEDITERDR